MKKKIMLSIVSLLLSLPLLVSCATAKVSKVPEADTEEKSASSCVLSLTEDAGDGYLDSILFFGESTTAHLISRGVLRGGTNTRQVLRPKSGTVNLGFDTKTIPVIDPYTNTEIPLTKAVHSIAPRFMILTFGLNGAVQNTKRGRERYVELYGSLIKALREASPNTHIIIQACPPVARGMDVSHYSVSVAELNACIKQINEWSRQISDAYSLSYLNTAEVLCDGEGYLTEAYDNGDGYHLSTEGYRAMLYYIRTHAHPSALSGKESE